MDRDRIADYQRLVAKLRLAESIRAELYLGSSGMKAPDEIRRPARLALRRHPGLAGGRKGEVQIKDLIEGPQAAGSIASHDEWKAARPAQVSVPEDELVEAVRKVLARHFA